MHIFIRIVLLQFTLTAVLVSCTETENSVPIAKLPGGWPVPELELPPGSMEAGVTETSGQVNEWSGQKAWSVNFTNETHPIEVLMDSAREVAIHGWLANSNEYPFDPNESQLSLDLARRGSPFVLHLMFSDIPSHRFQYTIAIDSNLDTFRPEREMHDAERLDNPVLQSNPAIDNGVAAEFDPEAFAGYSEAALLPPGWPVAELTIAAYAKRAPLLIEHEGKLLDMGYLDGDASYNLRGRREWIASFTSTQDASAVMKDTVHSLKAAGWKESIVSTKDVAADGYCWFVLVKDGSPFLISIKYHGYSPYQSFEYVIEEYGLGYRYGD